MRHNYLRPRDPQLRAGAVLICVLVCTLIAISLAASSIHLALQGARASKQNLRLRQTQWLLQAGLQRAHQALQQADYDGEEWIVPEEILPESRGRIVIDVTSANAESQEALQQVSDDAPDKRFVTVTAEYGAAGLPPMRRSYSFSIDHEPNN